MGKLERNMSTLIMVFAVFMLSIPVLADSLEKGVQAWEQGDFSQAVHYWEAEAENNAEAMLFLGFAYRHGKGVPRSPEKALYWYRQAAERGRPEAQLELSLMYELGIGTMPDPAEAASWYSLATRDDFCPSELPSGGRLGEP